MIFDTKNMVIICKNSRKRIKKIVFNYDKKKDGKLDFYFFVGL